MRKEVWGFKENVITYLDGELIGGHEEFLKWALENYRFQDTRFGQRRTMYECLQIYQIQSIPVALCKVAN